jgi:ABC-type phosphate transport system substrate-binding protein
MKIISTVLTLFILLTGTASFAAEVILITNPGNVVSAISPQDAKNIYLGKKSTWNDGNHVITYTQANAEITGKFTKNFIKKTAQQFNLYWRKAIFTGKGTPPKEVNNSEQMKKMVAGGNGTIGYILDSELDSTVKKLQVR